MKLAVSASQKTPSFRVGQIPIYGDRILAPMAGFSDLPYRSLCREYGSAMSYTEFVSALALLNGPNQKSLRMLAYREEERPVVFQIFDSEAERLEQAAVMISEFQPDIIDINMGCSVRNVAGKGAGAGLLRDPEKIGEIFSRISQALTIPVTGKIRLGWNASTLNYKEVVSAMESNGASLVAVHGRTKEQAYQGLADWDAIAEIVESTRLPVIGNGDVRTASDIAQMKSHTGCAAVMIGRGAIGHPWVFQGRDRHAIAFSEKAELILRHFELMLDFYGVRLSLLVIRKHITRYLKGHAGIKDLQHRLVNVQSVSEFHELLARVVARLEEENNPPHFQPSAGLKTVVV